MAEMAVGERIREMREARTLGLRECARMARLDAGQLSCVERGALPLSAGVAWRLSRILGPDVLALTESGKLLRALDLTDARRRPDMDQKAEDLLAFALPGGLRVFVPKNFPQMVTAGVGR